MNRKVILVDMDNTIADFESAMEAEIQTRHPEVKWVRDREDQECPEEFEDKFRAIMCEKGFFRSFKPLPGAVEALHKLQKMGHHVRLCTAPLREYQHCVPEKYAWVEEHLGRQWIRNIIITKDKTMVRGDYLVDDRDQTGIMSPTWEQIVFDQPYNRKKNGRRIKSWDEFIPLLRSTTHGQ